MHYLFNKKVRIIFFWVPLVGAIMLVGVSMLYLDRDLLKEKKLVTREITSISPLKSKNDSFAGIALEARAAVVIDLGTETKTTKNIIFGFNENTPLPLASLTKLMTAAIALEKGYGQNKKEEETISQLLVASSNQAAITIEHDISQQEKTSFIDQMNQKARDLSLGTMYFSNEIGVDEGEKTAGGYGSAKDVASLLAYDSTQYPNFFEQTSRATITLPSGTIKNTNILAGKIPGLKASKTGTTQLSLGNLAIIVESAKGKKYAIVVLGSSEDGRFTDVTTLLDRINLL